MSEGEADSAREHDDSCDEIRRHAGLLTDHGDVLAKLKMQVRDIKVQEDFDNRHLSFPMPNRTPTAPDSFQLPVPFPFQHPGAFLPPLAPQPAAPSSGSSHSSEGSVSSQQTWSFEEQFKQVRQMRYSKCFSNLKAEGAILLWTILMAKLLNIYERSSGPNC
ncbi:hypothetical protein FQR65_LT05409 [Abscondita terminalis]|nr:hypothetical protein FQR65_LT05409 [Abscondita terminalis]